MGRAFWAILAVMIAVVLAALLYDAGRRMPIHHPAPAVTVCPSLAEDDPCWDGTSVLGSRG